MIATERKHPSELLSLATFSTLGRVEVIATSLTMAWLHRLHIAFSTLGRVEVIATTVSRAISKLEKDFQYSRTSRGDCNKERSPVQRVYAAAFSTLGRVEVIATL